MADLSGMTQKTVESIATLYMADSFSERFVYHLGTLCSIRGIDQEKAIEDRDSLEVLIEKYLNESLSEIVESDLDSDPIESLDRLNSILDRSARQAAEDFIRGYT